LELNHLRAAWRWGRETRLHDERELPTTRVKIEDKRPRPTPKRRDVAAVLAHLDRWGRLAVLLYAGTGCRRGEIASLTWDRVALDDEAILVRGKTGYRAVPIPPPVVEALAAVPVEARVGFVLGVRPTTVAGNLHGIMARACEAAGVPRFSAQAVRRYVTTMVLGAGVPAAIESKLIGHSAEVAQRDYLAVDTDGRREAMQAARLGYHDEAPKPSTPVRRPRRGPA
ncbi:MAG TPA: tyrosine-type recombinase/integrase, partial [Salinarimonas sp.]|nr:tyrosine-type recombinase/integrase [Salinarimonas sp.]